jgi:hypothetical protein
MTRSSEQRVDQGRLADIRATDDRDLDAPGVVFGRLAPAGSGGHSARAVSTNSRTFSPCADDIGNGVPRAARGIRP